MRRAISFMLALMLMFGAAVPAAAAAEGDGVLGDTPVWEDYVQPDVPGGMEGMPQGDPAYDGAGELTDEPETQPAETPVPEQDTGSEMVPAPEDVPGFEDVPGTDGEPAPAPETDTAPVPEASETPLPEETGMEPSGEPSEEPRDYAALTSAALIRPITGQLDVSVRPAVSLGSASPVLTATLSTGGYSATLDTLDVTGKRNSFTDLPAGTYTLTVAGPGFVPYTQSGIEIKERDGALIQLTIGQLAGYTADMPHPGVLLYGDVDGSGSLDAADSEAIMGAVSGKTVSALTDLNGDEVTNLADAERLAKVFLSESMTATVEHFIPASAIVAMADEGTAVTGLENILTDNGVAATLGNQDGTAISAEKPVAVSFGMADTTTDAIVLADTNITGGEIDIECEDGTVLHGVLGTEIQTASVDAAFAAAVPPVEVESDGAGGFIVKLGRQQAVKRVTLKITGVYGAETSLASISQVEFVNGMKSRIPEPELSIPQGLAVTNGSRQFTVSWTPCTNITGYVAYVSEGTSGVTEEFSLTGTSLTVTNFNKDEVVNGLTYSIQVRSVNGSWSSGLSEAVTAMPTPSGRPDKPDNVKATGSYQTVTVTWKNMKDTDSYDLYYKEETAPEYTKIELKKVTSYAITGLDSTKPTTYEVYVVGKNAFGDSDPSMHAAATTVTLDPPEMSRFNLINRDGNGRPGPYHIQSAIQNSGVMVQSPQDAGGTAWGTVDGDPASYYDRATWDDGGYNGSLGAHLGLRYTFDAAYEIDTIGMMSVDAGMDYTYVKVKWWDASGVEHYLDRNVMSSEKRMDAAGRTYFFIRLPEPVQATSIQIGAARYWAGNNRISVSEVYFYKYDSLKREIMDLYADELHMTLKDDVTKEQLEQLKSRIETSVDEFGEVNPDRAQLLKEWDTAWQIYNDQFLGKVTKIHTGITGSGDDHGFGGLNAWQPLGVTAAAGENITVYVRHGNAKTGSGTNLQLVATQYNAEASAMSKVLTTLKVGANEIQIPKIWTTTGVESGGALYVQYTGGASTADDYAVRVSGGVSVPVLDLYKVADQGERLNRVSAYLAELGTYAANISAAHEEKHLGSDCKEVQYPFDNSTCILGASDIMLDTMMLSLPAQQIVAGCGGDASRLLASLNAMENMMHLFYQHKGLNAAAEDAVDRIPNRHLNIRYQRMFSGAFMYASGDHIGIGWNETDDMAGCGGVAADASGLYQSGSYFGWGIAHEIGHDINQGCYAIAEVTNNYFAVLAQAQDTNGSVRFEYPKVYEKVTSGTTGSANNVFTQLGMYWQLHLAYDSGYNFKTYDSYADQLANLFWARVDTYARSPKKAPNGLTLEGASSDQILMRLCCAAAGRNILDFFVRWGKTPDEGTIAYASQFPEETRAIYYVCDDSRRYTISHGGASKLSETGDTAAIASAAASVDANQANKVTVTVTPNETVPADQILGYEIVRRTVSGGRVERKTVGFTTESTFTDVIYAMNNRAVSYEVTLVDQYLNRSAAAVTNTVKIEHRGDLDSAHWTVTAYGLEAAPIKSTETNMYDPEVVETDPATLAVDGKVETVYTAVVGEGACIEVDFHEEQVITGFGYVAGESPIGGYTVDVRQHGEWMPVYSGKLTGDATVYFPSKPGDGDSTPYVSTYSADAIRLHLTGAAGGTVSIAELRVLGLTGDNVDFRRAEDSGAAIGYLAADFKYGDGDGDVIRRGSLVFTGSYKGNAAYNVVMLFDQDGNVVGGLDASGSLNASQIILADIPTGGSIQDVTDGTWIYWLDPDVLGGFTVPQMVRAELYRVNDAQTNEGERLVSDSLLVTVPQPLGQITIENSHSVVSNDHAVG